jgi:hypothetical protein
VLFRTTAISPAAAEADRRAGGRSGGRPGGDKCPAGTACANGPKSSAARGWASLVSLAGLLAAHAVVACA